jgi:NAD(P)H dehydrogenase (quinone)
MIAITGATGKLGRLVVDALLKRVSSDKVVTAVRRPDKALDLAARGVNVRQANYDVPESFATGFSGAEKLLGGSVPEPFAELLANSWNPMGRRSILPRLVS